LAQHPQHPAGESEKSQELEDCLRPTAVGAERQARPQKCRVDRGASDAVERHLGGGPVTGAAGGASLSRLFVTSWPTVDGERLLRLAGADSGLMVNEGLPDAVSA